MHNFTKSLPTEVWLVIFGYLRFTGTLGQCRLVCRSWRPLVDKITYKELNLRIGMSDTVLANLGEFLEMRPDLGRLVQKIIIFFGFDCWPQMYEILRHTPNLKVIDGSWSDELAKKVLAQPECSALKLEQLPRIVDHKKVYLESMLHFKNTLRSAAFTFHDFDHCDYRALSNSLNQLKHLQQLTIVNEFAFNSLRDLDNMLMDCNQIQHLRLHMYQYKEYKHTDKVELEQWLANGVQRVKTVKTLTIEYDDGFRNGKGKPHEFGPDWMYYLTYKYPNLTRLEVNCCCRFQRQHLILPKAMHLDTFVLKNWKFYDIDLLKQFIDMLATQSVYVKYTANSLIRSRGRFICLMSAVKEVPTECTRFSIELPCDGNIKANTTSVMSLFSSRLIKKFEMNLSGDDHLGSICAAMKCSLNVQSFKITTYDRLLTEYPEQPIFTVLHRLEIVNTRFKSDFLTQLSKYAPRSLTHLTLDNCAFEDRVSVPSIQLASLSLQITKGEDMVHRESRSGIYLLFRISTSKYPEQMFLAMPQKPLQRVTKGEAKLLKAPTIYIECGSLKHLSVDLGDFKFEMKFDDADSLIERVDIEDSYYTTLERKVKTLEEDRKKMENRVKVAEDKYLKSKKYLNTLQIKTIEDSVSPPRTRSKCRYNLRNA